MAAKKQSDIAFLMMKEWREQLALLTDEQRGKLLTAIYDYQCDGVDLQTDDALINMLWVSIKNTFERNKNKYEQMCKKNRENIAKRWENTTVYDRKKSDTKNTDRDSDIDRDSDSDSDRESENDNTSSSLTLGKFNNIIISQSEYDAFRHDYPRIFSQEIERLSAYMKSTDKSYSNHYATLVRWADADSKKANNDKPQIASTYDIDKIAKDALFNDDYDI